MRALGHCSEPSVWIIRFLTVVLLLGLSGAAMAEDEDQVPRWVSKTGGLEVVGLSSLAIHPQLPNVMWAHVHGLGLARSTNGGRDWVLCQEGIDPRHVPGPRDMCQISLDPRDEKTLWLATKGYVYKSQDRGDTWVNKTTNALSSLAWDRSRTTYAIRGVVVDPRKSDHVVAGTRTGGAWRGGLYESVEGGDTWQLIAGTDVNGSELGHDAWPIVLDPSTHKNVVVGGTSGFWFSDDRGRRFRRADPGEIGSHDVQAITEMAPRTRDIYLCDGRGLWSSRDGGKRWAREPNLEGDAVAAVSDPFHRRRLYAVLRDRGLFMSEDARHAKWEELGHADAEIREILPHPHDKGRFFFASPVSGLHESSDLGKTLELVKVNVKPVVPPVATVALHPMDVNRAMAATVRGVIFLSTDRGETWIRAGRLGMCPTLIRGDPAGSDVWWAAGREVLRSPDNGATWETVYQPEDPEERVLDVRVLEDGSIWVLLERSQVICHSDDGGSEWKTTEAPSRTPDAWATAFDVDPSNVDHLVLATRNLTPLWKPKDEEGGPWESWDGGKTWTSLRSGLFENGKPKRNWNRGSLAVIDPASGLLFYAADGLGLFARAVVDPKGKKAASDPVWVDISPPIPNLRVNAFLLRPVGEDGDAEVYVQAEGGNDTRTFVRTLASHVGKRVVPPEDGVDADGPLWEDLPDAPARVTCLVADPHLEGRLLASDVDGVAGVLVYGIPGELPPGADAEPGARPPRPTGPVPPDGLLAFTGGGDGQIRVWSLAEEKVISGLLGNTKEVLAITFAPDESVIATGGAQRCVLLFDGVDGTLLDKSLAPDRFDATVNTLVFHPDSKRLYVGMEQNWALVEWNVETDETRLFDAHTGGVLCAAVTPDGKRVVSGSRDQTVRCWDIETAKTILRINVGTEVLGIALSPDASRIYVGGRGPTVWVYDATSGEGIGKADLQAGFVSDLALNPDGTRLYVAGDSGVVTIDTETLQPVHPVLEGPAKPVFCIALSRDGEWIVAGDSENGLWMWRKDRPKPWWQNDSAHAGPVHAIALTPDVAEAEDEAEDEAEAEPE